MSLQTFTERHQYATAPATTAQLSGLDRSGRFGSVQFSEQLPSGQRMFALPSGPAGTIFVFANKPPKGLSESTNADGAGLLVKTDQGSMELAPTDEDMRLLSRLAEIGELEATERSSKFGLEISLRRKGAQEREYRVTFQPGATDQRGEWVAA